MIAELLNKLQPNPKNNNTTKEQILSLCLYFIQG